MINFRKWLEFADQGGEVSYNHMNNVAAGDGFSKIKSKWMSGGISERSKNFIKIFGKNRNKNNK